VAARPVLRFPHAALKRAARELASDERALIASVEQDLLDTMREAPGCVGLAAPQIGAEVRMVVVDCSAHPKAADANNGLLVLVNPVVVAEEGAEVGREGCLSIPHLTANVRRATSIVVESGAGGRVERVESVGFEARCLQHEIDHLDGVLFLDRVDSLARDVFRRKTYR
jgi:peptide deformylase